MDKNFDRLPALCAPASTTAAASASTPAPVGSTTVPTHVVENVKLSSKDWIHYKGCDDTCLSLCLDNPAGFDSKCSILFSNNTKTVHPTSESCTKPQVIRDCTDQCRCNCKRCSFCKQDLINSCEADKNPHECFDHVIDNIITNAKRDEISLFIHLGLSNYTLFTIVLISNVSREKCIVVQTTSICLFFDELYKSIA